jgi:hypothetical protein
MGARFAERQAAQGAHLLLELAGNAGIDGVVAAVVRARCHFIDDQATPADEELDAHGADVAELFGDSGGDLASAGLANLAGESEGSAEASAGIYVDGEPASEGLDLTADPASTGEIGIEEDAPAPPKSRAKKK